MRSREMRVGHIVKSIASASALLAVIVGAHTDARANGCQGPCPVACLVNTSSSLGNTLQGTITAVVTDYNGAAGVVDATARLQWKGKERIYRTHLGDPTNLVPVVSPEDLTCQVLAADPIDVDSGQTLSQVVGVSPSNFKLNTRSITGVNFNAVPGGGATSSAIADATIYVVTP